MSLMILGCGRLQSQSQFSILCIPILSLKRKHWFPGLWLGGFLRQQNIVLPLCPFISQELFMLLSTVPEHCLPPPRLSRAQLTSCRRLCNTQPVLKHVGWKAQLPPAKWPTTNLQLTEDQSEPQQDQRSCSVYQWPLVIWSNQVTGQLHSNR